MAIDVAYLETSEFCAAHAGTVESYQQRSPKQCPRPAAEVSSDRGKNMTLRETLIKLSPFHNRSS